MFTTSMDSIITHYCPAPGRHWFDRDSKRFFRSRMPQQAYVVGEYQSPRTVAYFVTSEQFVGSDRRPARRMYSVREYNYETRDINTIGEFNSMSKSAANTLAMRLAKDWIPGFKYGEVA